MIAVPEIIAAWFAARQWQVRDHQLAMLDAFARQQSSLLIAPTGAGKTLAGFLPSLIDICRRGHSGLHTLYISPLKALTHDIERNLSQPVAQMGLDISIETRTGDTSSYKRQRQRRKPPHLLLTTPESLMLMLSYTDAPQIFKSLKAVIVDEVHSFAHNKRGDFTSLALARLRQHAPDCIRFGLSATVAAPAALAAWLGPAGEPVAVLRAAASTPPRIRILDSKNRMPYSGFMAGYAVEAIYQAVAAARTTLVFVNTRAQAELVFQQLWQINKDNLPIAVYHGSLSKEQRRKTENLMAAGSLRAVVTTSALELGVDWGDVDLVIQVGAPKGVSRLLQRIGRANHRLHEPSEAWLVPANRFEALECQSAIDAIASGRLDGEALLPGSNDIVPQFIMNCACSEAIRPAAIYRQVRSATPYADMPRATFDALFRFAVDGGYALRNYERYRRLEEHRDGTFTPSSRSTVQRHRQNIGTIVEAGRLKVKRLRRSHQGRIVGEVEEYFAQQLTPGDTFIFNGEVLMFEGVRDMLLEARPVKSGEPKIPSYVGGQMPLSTFLSDGVRALLNRPQHWSRLPADVREWLELQRRFSAIPPRHRLLVEQFPHRGLQYVVFYTFEGRKANQTLGILLTRRMERLQLQPVSFSITDYGLSICALEALGAAHIDQLFAPEILGDELEDWLMETPMLKRSFRRVATISGLAEQNHAGKRKTLRQMTFSTDLIYDVLRKYDADHILLTVSRQDAERELLDIRRLAEMLVRFAGKTVFKALDRASPMALNILFKARDEQVRGAGLEVLLEQVGLQDQAQQMMDEVRDVVGV